MARQIDHGAPDSAFQLELALGYLSERNFGLALAHTERHIQAVGNASVGLSSLYLYLLARNDRLDQAQAIVQNLEQLGVPELDAFIGWYRANYSQSLAARADSSAQATP